MTIETETVIKTSPQSPRAPTPVDLEIAEKIRLRRIECEMTIVQVAEIVGTTHQQMQKYERGLNRITISKFLIICGALRINRDDILPRDPIPRKLKKS